MEIGNKIIVLVFVLVLQFNGYSTNCVDSALYSWPLGEGIFSYEMVNQDWSGDHFNIGYNNGPLNYSTVQFVATDQSFIELDVPDALALDRDFSVTFFFYPETDGVFLHYRSDDFGNSTGRVDSIMLEMNGGNISLSVSSTTEGETVANVGTNITYNTWHRFKIERIFNNPEFGLTKGAPEGPGSMQALMTASWLPQMRTSFPGTLRLGGSLDGDNFVSGRAACVQMITCRMPPDFSADCAMANWPTTTASTTTATTTPTAAGTTTTASTSTSTTVPTPTTSTTAVPPTTTAGTTPTPTETTPTTTTTTPTATTTTPTTTTPTTTTTAPTTTTTTPTATTTTPTTTTTTPTAMLYPATPIPVAGCKHYRLLNVDVNFTVGDALCAVTLVDSPLACSVKCSTHGDCWSFVFRPGGSCWLGHSSPGTVGETGAIMYEVA